MPNESTGVDGVLDWIVPVRLSGKWMSVEVERGLKIMLSLILLATIPTHAISKTLEVLPPDAVNRLVWTKFSLYLLCDIIVYVGIVAGFLLLKPFVQELIEIIEEFVKKKTETNDKDPLIQEVVPMVKVDPIEVPLPIHSKPQPSEPESEILDYKRKYILLKSHQRTVSLSLHQGQSKPIQFRRRYGDILLADD